MVGDFRTKDSSERVTEIIHQQKKLEELERKKLEGVDVEQAEKKQSKESSFSSKKNNVRSSQGMTVEDQKNIVKNLKIEHAKIELIDFLKSSRFESIKTKLIQSGFDSRIFDLMKGDKAMFSEISIEDLFSKLPRYLGDNIGKGNSIKFSQDEMKIIFDLLDKATNLLVQYMPDISFKDILNHLNIVNKSAKDQWSSVHANFNQASQSVSTDKAFTESERNNIKFFMTCSFLALHVIAIVLFVYGEKSHKKDFERLLEGLVALDAFGAIISNLPASDFKLIMNSDVVKDLRLS